MVSVDKSKRTAVLLRRKGASGVTNDSILNARLNSINRPEWSIGGWRLPTIDECKSILSTARIVDEKSVDLNYEVDPGTYYCTKDGKLATVLIPFEDIQKYSDEYNPNVLILEELRLVEGVEVAVAIKTYPDGKLTGKIRSSKPIADQLAGFFGGGGHPYAAGFRIYEEYASTLPELIGATMKLLDELPQDNL